MCLHRNNMAEKPTLARTVYLQRLSVAVNFSHKERNKKLKSAPMIAGYPKFLSEDL